MDMRDFLHLPGFGDRAPAAPAALEPLPTREDPDVAAAREKLRLSEKRRKGRSATILTGGQGVAGEGLGNLTRPEAGRQATLLGG